MGSDPGPGALPSRSRGAHRTLLLLAALAMVTRASLILARPLAPLEELATSAPDDARYYARLAQHLATTGQYAENHLRAYRPPGYPAAVAAAIRLGLGSQAIQVLQNLAYLACLGVLVRWATQRGGPMAGVLTALLGLLTTNWLLLPQELLSETLFLTLLMAALALGPARVARPTPGTVMAMGACFGLAALVREVALPLGFLATGLLAVQAIPLRGGRGEALRILIAGSLGLLLAILPWTYRNYRIFSALVPITTNGAINLYMGNNPAATGEYRWALPDSAQAVWNKPGTGPSDELYVMRAAKVAALVYIRDHPGAIIALAPKKLWALWGPPLELRGGLGPSGLIRISVACLWLVTLLAGCAGLWRLRRDALGRFVLLMLLAASGIHIATYGSPRYRSAYEFLLLLPAGVALGEAVGRFRQRGRNEAANPAPRA